MRVQCTSQHPAHAVAAAYFALVSGPAGERVPADFVELFANDSRIDAMGVDVEGKNVLFPQSPREFADHLNEYREEVGFYQSAVSTSARCYMRSASLDIWFESRNQPDGVLIDDGLLSMHLLRLNNGWRVTHIQWNSRPTLTP